MISRSHRSLRELAFAWVLLFSSVAAMAVTVTSVKKDGKGAGLVGDEVDIIGSGFTQGPGGPSIVQRVDFNGIQGTIISVTSEANLRAKIPIGATSGNVRVTLNSGTFAESPEIFIVGTQPYIRRFTPIAGSPGTPVMIFGENFNLAHNGGNSVTGVLFGGVPVTSGNTANQDRLDVVVPAGARSGPITVFTVFNGQTLSNITTSNFFLAPTITNFTPTSAVANATIQLQGINFLGASQVKFGAFNAAFSDVSNSNLLAQVPAGFRRGKFTLTTPGGSIESVNEFLVPPSVNTFMPAFGPPGTMITVAGTNLINISSVKLGATAVTSFTTNAAGNQLQFSVPANATSGSIMVTTDTGSAESAEKFYLRPIINSISPGSGTAGTLVTINGQHFNDVISVTFSGVAAAFTVTTPGSQVRATVPQNIFSGPLVVQTPGGSVTNTANFSIVPQIFMLDPATALVGDTITIRGTNFTPASAVRFFSSVNAMETFVSSTELTAVVPVGTQNGRVTVSTDGGSAQSPVDFTLATPPPPPVTNVTLSILHTNPSVFIRWPATSGVWQLQVLTNLNAPMMWSNNLAPTSTVSGSFQVTRPATNGIELFRLMKP